MHELGLDVKNNFFVLTAKKPCRFSSGFSIMSLIMRLKRSLCSGFFTSSPSSCICSPAFFRIARYMYEKRNPTVFFSFYHVFSLLSSDRNTKNSFLLSLSHPLPANKAVNIVEQECNKANDNKSQECRYRKTRNLMPTLALPPILCYTIYNRAIH